MRAPYKEGSKEKGFYLFKGFSRSRDYRNPDPASRRALPDDVTKEFRDATARLLQSNIGTKPLPATRYIAPAGFQPPSPLLQCTMLRPYRSAGKHEHPRPRPDGRMQRPYN